MQPAIIYSHKARVLILSALLSFLLGITSILSLYPFNLNLINYFLNILLSFFFIGFSIYLILTKPKQLIQFDKELQTIKLSHQTKLNEIFTTISFQDITSMEIVTLDGPPNTYDIEVTLKNGIKFYLFSNGDYGKTDKITMEKRIYEIKRIVFPENEFFFQPYKS